MTLGDSVVEVEGEEKGVVAIVQALGDVLRAGRKSPPPQPTAVPALGPSPRAGDVDIRSFFREKNPSSDVEATAVAAYYYKYLAPPEDRKEAIDAQALQEAFRQGGRPLPARAIYTLVNARNAGYVDSTGETGFYRLNPVGFNLVEHALGKPKAQTQKRTTRRVRPQRSQKPHKANKK